MSLFDSSKYYPSFVSNQNDFVQVGKISRKHGYKGDVILAFEFADNIHFCEKKHPLYLELEGKLVPFFFEKAAQHKINQLCIKLEDVSSEQQVSSIIGATVYLSKEFFPASERNDFHLQELVGFSVEDINSNFAGIITGFSYHSIQSLLEISSDKKSVLIPVVDEFILEIIPEEKKIVLSLPDGLIDL